MNTEDYNAAAAMYKILRSKEFKLINAYCESRQNCSECVFGTTCQDYSICTVLDVPNLEELIENATEACKTYLKKHKNKDLICKKMILKKKRLSELLKSV